MIFQGHVLLTFIKELEANPNAYLLPKLIVFPQKWWEKLYPDEVAKDNTGKPFQTGFSAITMCSEVWKRDIKKALKVFYNHMESSPYADRIVGYWLCGGSGPEWHYWSASWKNMMDYSKAAQKGFRKYLIEKHSFKRENALKKRCITLWCRQI